MNSPDLDRWMDARLEAYLDGDLLAAERRRFEDRLIERPAWQNELRRARRIRETLRTVPTPPCPPGVTRAVLRRMPHQAPRTDRAPQPRRVLRKRWWQPVLAAGLLLLAVALAPLVSPPPDAPQPFESNRYTEAEVRRAAAEARWTLAFVAAVGERTGRTLRHDVLDAHVAEPLQNALRTALLEPISISHEKIN